MVAMAIRVFLWVVPLLIASCIQDAASDTPPVPRAAWPEPGELDSLTKWVDELRECRSVPGLGLAIVTPNNTWTNGFGEADVKTGTTVTPHTRFCIASLTKAFTTMALGMLLQNSSYTWDTPIRLILGDEVTFMDSERTHRVTIRDLLLHRVGLERFDMTWYGAALGRSQIFSMVKCMSSAFPLRSQATYNNVMYAVAGRVLEVLGGKPYEELIEDLILRQLGMKNTTFFRKMPWATGAQSGQKRGDPGKFASHYWFWRGEISQIDSSAFSGATDISPAISMCSSASDMAIWAKVLMNDGKNEQGNQVLPVAVIKECFRVQITTDAISYKPNIWVDEKPILTLDQYGLGWFVGSYKGQHIVSHYGSFPGYYTQISVLPERKIAVFSTINGGDQKEPYNINTVLHSHIIDLVQGLDPEIMGTESPNRRACLYPRTEPRNYSAIVNKEYETIEALRPLDFYTGIYFSPNSGNVTVRINNHTKALHLAYGLLQFNLTPTKSVDLNKDAFYGDITSGHWPSWKIPISFYTDSEGHKFVKISVERSSDGRFLHSVTGNPFTESCDFPSSASGCRDRHFLHHCLVLFGALSVLLSSVL